MKVFKFLFGDLYIHAIMNLQLLVSESRPVFRCLCCCVVSSVTLTDDLQIKAILPPFFSSALNNRSEEILRNFMAISLINHNSTTFN